MEIKKRLVLLNVITSGGQVVFIGLVYFLLYKYLLSKLGVELLGVWSVVLSTSSLANLANFGVADSVIRFVALFTAEKDDLKIKQLIFTSTIFLTVLFILIAAIIYPFADLILTGVLPAKYIKQGLSILPYSLICLVINAVNGIYASVLDGMQRNYIRNMIFSASSILLLVGTYVLVPLFHLKGVAFAQVGQSIFTAITCLTLIVFRLKYNPFKWNWSKVIFKQIFSYGMKFQFISLAAMVNEPIIKILLGKFGGMAFAGYYEMANRLLSQARGVIVSATQSLVPVLVNVSKGDVPIFYKRVFSNVVFFSLAVVCIIVPAGRLISFYWIGHYEHVFYVTLVLLAFSTFINLLITPSYFYYIAKANLNILIKTHLMLSFSNVLIGAIVGYFFGGYGVVCGWFLATIIGSFYLMTFFNKDHDIVFKTLIMASDVYYFIVLISIVLINVFFFKSNFKIIDPIVLLIIISITVYYFMKYKFAEIRRT
ncbi:lipopolysaccharide biosynthesis protein [Mucilaginibacter gotjawali]|uniref:Polysaccharide biosynthesis protein n=2 Tax=Mucilaginibacter gotjawali TaxID=1550579 RepID=A0A110B484_9SPHI|nr:lipopolysaccharide biosynthesis protein [Mucilaginibacter gotjawali]MBB3058524.1 O-antigen/teichoic acid export membrane protein [Mucilaginibacter gotjawali]BAU55748.1 Polysaccharide biosynthesis protein [Mucilaginibacter gotjawali]